ncbi:hypothetical protein H8F21_15160 [Pseudomonas sp. P66]|uniref:Uncharacterized protein n=1 Tax=Pseudomonas arcuscaelestis TaxID=2710591 RepID=A0ABS2BZ86_9PSED|nr:hypothetical protein [Pseudomonas arcuscaelestis]MBM5458904.1 hypothetical protein [Pseudomonas arcuscaelestis]
MTTKKQTAQTEGPMLDRSKQWLESQPDLPKVKNALFAIVSKVTNGELKDDHDSRDTCDALTEYYVDRGGDLADLAVLPDAPGGAEAVTSSPAAIGPAVFDCGSLYPDGEPAPQLSKEEKQRRLRIIRSSLVRPGGF